ncbi:unnamed protein product [Miscanthus lutarioriparius]|uniref:Uncharacterized protein n=1 Tax=Miscanthus lutarioriparius TaxID=422564 RepID=A0A811RXD1_9POAL|nr:unnamed protein product [Miscanthus lutarioriparius]
MSAFSAPGAVVLGGGLRLREFQEFEDKSAAINRTTGVGKQLRDMLKVWCRCLNKLLVGSLEYKEIIEADQELGITCFYDDLVEELMWGMKNLMRSLVPQEQKVLTKEKRLPMSKGLEMILRCHNFDVKPEMKHSRSLHMSDSDLMEISGFNSQDWDTMKIATAMKMIAYPDEKVEHPLRDCRSEQEGLGRQREEVGGSLQQYKSETKSDGSEGENVFERDGMSIGLQLTGEQRTDEQRRGMAMFSKDELSKIQKDASKYNDKIIKHDVAKVFEELVRAKRCKEIKVTLMRHLVREATLMVGETANKRLNQADD